ncbi:GNAT family N-acetyltransferase [Anaerosporobacter faecicola]|uniref:GNAT family N-acetyltransferase n=1 Tax=Anaerosporobacter faecicola TaxID=2718714 RepID=UPI002ECFD701
MPVDNHIDHMQLEKLKEKQINRELFANFNRHQVVKECYRKVDGKWCIKEDPFIDDWSEEEYEVLIQCLRNTIATGGFVLGAFEEDKLKGFVSVESGFLGTNKEYMDLSSIHISEELRGQGIGRKLFGEAKKWAKEQGAKKLYISSHSAVESQAFYHAMGCVEALEYNKEHVEKEPCDCQLECVL